MDNDLGMARYSELPALWVRLCTAAGVAPTASLDVVHARIGVVGRGTLQRIRDGVPGTQMKSIQAIADHLGVPVADLMDDPAPKDCAAPRDAEQLVQMLAALLDRLEIDGQEHASKALQALAAAPDSAKAKAAVVRALQSAASGKRSSRAA